MFTDLNQAPILFLILIISSVWTLEGDLPCFYSSSSQKEPPAFGLTFLFLKRLPDSISIAPVVLGGPGGGWLIHVAPKK